MIDKKWHYLGEFIKTTVVGWMVVLPQKFPGLPDSVNVILFEQRAWQM